MKAHCTERERETVIHWNDKHEYNKSVTNCNDVSEPIDLLANRSRDIFSVQLIGVAFIRAPKYSSVISCKVRPHISFNFTESAEVIIEWLHVGKLWLFASIYPAPELTV